MLSDPDPPSDPGDLSSDPDVWDEGEEGEEEEELEFDPEIVPPPPMCSHCGGSHDDVNCPLLTLQAVTSRVYSQVGSTDSQKARKESAIVRTKDLDNFKISTLPKDAAAFRGCLLYTSDAADE